MILYIMIMIIIIQPRRQPSLCSRTLTCIHTLP